MARHATNPSRYLSLVLRHKPEVAGVALDANGWASVDAVVAAVRRRCGAFTKEDLRQLVRANDKQRFQLSPNGQRVRAVQGHSIPVDLTLAPAEPPQTLYHGTKAATLAAIKEQGLLPMGRQYVHLSTTVPDATVVARRRAGAGVILRVTPAKSQQPFFQAANGVWLTTYVAPECLLVERWLEEQ